ncbi:MAG: biosynthetic-type acetolactate synthase large subunit [Thermoplasmata archaeon YP2-bin.285]|uniref:Acetolactate synthase n=1 Tax=Candidatus Sysuiplasma superficiale TaxID=2823368 RepID=A0A8J7YKI8_9ARCH|nr:biosynthetic-type acetolactate synthase large subunit [Candidatus Sysuiplasma superficiale]
MRGAKILVNTMTEHGVRTLFGIPGGANLPIYDELMESSIRSVLARHEGGAAHMADGYARVSGKPGVCLGTSGPGATNMITGLATAYMDSSPVICLTGQVSTKVVGNDAFQESDSFDLMIPVTKSNFKIHSADEIPYVLNRAFAISMSGRYGPVAVDVPTDTVAGDASAEPTLHSELEYTRTDLSSFSAAVSMLNGAERPAILVGGGAKWAGCGREILELAEMLGSPVVTTVMGKGSVDESHPLVMGTTGMHGRRSSALVLDEADVVLAVATRFSDRTTGKSTDFLPKAGIIHVDIDGAEIGKNVKNIVGLTGNCSEIISLLRNSVKRGTELRLPWLRRVSAVRSFCQCEFGYSDYPLKPQRVIYELSRLLPEDAILTTDVGQHQMFAAHFFEARGRRRFITSGGLGTMGFGLPAAIGAKAAEPETKTVCLTGDGGFQMTFGEFSTAVENELPVFVVVMNNNSLGMIRQFQKHFYNNHIFSADYRVHPDFVKFAESMGGAGVVVERPGEVAEAIERGLKSDVPFVADVRIDINEDCLPMTPPWAGKNGTIYGRCKWKDVNDSEIKSFGR